MTEGKWIPLHQIRWEYLIANVDEHDFNSLGKMGYELVAVDQGKAYFKRFVGVDQKWVQLAKNSAKEILDIPTGAGFCKPIRPVDRE